MPPLIRKNINTLQKEQNDFQNSVFVFLEKDDRGPVDTLRHDVACGYRHGRSSWCLVVSKRREPEHAAVQSPSLECIEIRLLL